MSLDVSKVFGTFTEMLLLVKFLARFDIWQRPIRCRSVTVVEGLPPVQGFHSATSMLDGRRRRPFRQRRRTKKSFDRGAPVWPPRSNAKDDRLGGPKTRGLEGSAPQPNPKIFEKF